MVLSKPSSLLQGHNPLSSLDAEQTTAFGAEVAFVKGQSSCLPDLPPSVTKGGPNLCELIIW